MTTPTTPRRVRSGILAILFALATAVGVMACGSAGTSGEPNITFDNGGDLATDSLAEPTVAQ